MSDVLNSSPQDENAIAQKMNGILEEFFKKDVGCFSIIRSSYEINKIFKIDTFAEPIPRIACDLRKACTGFISSVTIDTNGYHTQLIKNKIENDYGKMNSKLLDFYIGTITDFEDNLETLEKENIKYIL